MESRKRSIVKGITWRLIAQTATLLIVYFFTGDLQISLGVTVVGLVVSFVLYYLHERVWSRVGWGR